MPRAAAGFFSLVAALFSDLFITFVLKQMDIVASEDGKREISAFPLQDDNSKNNKHKINLLAASNSRRISSWPACVAAFRTTIILSLTHGVLFVAPALPCAPHVPLWQYAASSKSSLN